MVDGTGSSWPSAIPRMVLRRILPEPRLGQRADHVDPADSSDRADLVADELDELCGQDGRVCLDASLQDDETARYLALLLVVPPMTAHSATAG